MKKLNLMLVGALFSLQAFSQTPKCDYLCNQGFDNTTPSISMVSLLNSSQIPCWKTTSADGLIEVWGTGYNGVPSYSGSQFCEINGTQSQTVYQNFIVPAGTSTNLNIGFAHRGRAGVDVMKVEIGPVGGPYTTLGTYSDGTSWNYYTASYTVPSAGGNYSLRFTSISWAGGNPKIGNFLDAVSVCGTPGGVDPPVDPPVSQCDQCKETRTQLRLFEIGDADGNTDVSFHLNSGGRTITKIRITLLNFNVTLSDPSCANYCDMTNEDFGHITDVTKPIETYPVSFAPYNPNILNPPFTNQIEMASSNPRVIDDIITMNIKFPPIHPIPGCSQMVEACFRIELIDDNCVVCERMICTTQSIEPKNMKIEGGPTEGRSLKVFPNPNAGSFTINTTEIGKGCGYQLLTLEGKEVKSGRIEGQVLEISNDNLSNGTYMLYVFSGNETFVEKIVVVKN